MKFSNYNLYLEKYPYCETTLIYNTLTKASVVAHQDLIDIITKKKDVKTKEDKNYIRELKNLGIIVDDDISEKLRMNHWYNKTRFSNVVWNGVIVPTTDCDLQCVYCYQEGAKTNHYITKEIQNSIIEWFKNKIEKFRPKQIFWAFFGGEPLLDLTCVDYLTKKMKKLCDKKDVIFQFSIITNGTNLFKKKTEQWNKYGLVSVQVTLDGCKEIHDYRRPFIGGKGSFSRIFKNIKDSANLTDLILRINIDSHNLLHIPEFLDFLKEQKLQNKITPFYGLLLDANINLAHQKKYKMKEKEGAKGILYLREEAIMRGFKVTEILEGGPCVAKAYASVLIDPKGKIFKCTGQVGLEQFAIGNVTSCDISSSRCKKGKVFSDDFAVGDVSSSDEEQFEILSSQYTGIQLDNTCLDCKFCPICLGGCPYKSLTRYGTLTKKVCEKGYYETVYKDVLKQMYKEEEIKQKLI